jgi:hypothetical protein
MDGSALRASIRCCTEIVPADLALTAAYYTNGKQSRERGKSDRSAAEETQQHFYETIGLCFDFRENDRPEDRVVEVSARAAYKHPHRFV